ncbi:glycosyltransferase family 2 protein [Acinetobacter ursingii]|uniref:glycosyltransferase family 2 protein n=1 Tax=Acinetobacter ursingii TaxID=108980 RepID=UPI0021CD1E3A|nr:glycosyltransferase family 2 protein [Acinetobacter ursingii]MCU4523656.1 glycosyltransferase family 2 protein [Acinetobacter ursingii]
MNICTLIVTYNPDIHKLKNLINSLLTFNGVRIVVVDNNSSNIDSIKEIGKVSDLVKIEILSDNKGIAYAQNVGIQYAIEEQSEFILFFDQDSVIDSEFIKELYCDFNELIRKNIKLAAIGPRFIDEKNNFYFPALRLNKFGLIDKLSIENISEPMEVSVLISSGTLVSVDALKEIGLMREEFFIDFVDTEWCFRALGKGYRIYVSGNAIMKHSIGDETIQLFNFKIPVHSGFRRYYRIRNLFFMWKMPYIPRKLTAKLMVSNLFHQFLLFLLKDNKADYIKYYYKAVLDGIKQSKNYQV